MGSEKLTERELAYLRACVSGSFAAERPDGFDRDDVTLALLSAYEATQRPIEPDPDAPLDVADLPAFWDERRKRLGKNASVCAAELRRALEQRAGGVTHEEARASYAALGFDPDTGPLGVYIAQQADRDRAHAEIGRQLAAAERGRDEALKITEHAQQKRAEAESARIAATARAETAEGLLRDLCEAVDRDALITADDVWAAQRAARAHLQSLKGGGEP